MAEKYLMQDHLEQVPPSRPVEEGVAVVEVLTSSEFAMLSPFVGPDMQGELRRLATVENTYLDTFPHCFIGSLAVPDKQHVTCEPHCFAFYLDKDHLVFLDEGTTCIDMLRELAEQGVVKEPTAAHCLFEFLKLLVKDDLSYLANLEDMMEDVEEDILDRGSDVADRGILGFRRKLLRIDTYYQQLVDMASGIANNENKLLTHEQSRMFATFERQVERLLDRSLTLKEYSLQLRELYQTQLGVQQNDTMQFFTVITTLFMPLTLITSWFGMNFIDMPGLDAAWGYPAVIGISLIIIGVEIAVFKRKGWL